MAHGPLQNAMRQPVYGYVRGRDKMLCCQWFWHIEQSNYAWLKDQCEGPNIACLMVEHWLTCMSQLQNEWLACCISQCAKRCMLGTNGPFGTLLTFCLLLRGILGQSTICTLSRSPVCTIYYYFLFAFGCPGNLYQQHKEKLPSQHTFSKKIGLCVRKAECGKYLLFLN